MLNDQGYFTNISESQQKKANQNQLLLKQIQLIKQAVRNCYQLSEEKQKNQDLQYQLSKQQLYYQKKLVNLERDLNKKFLQKMEEENKATFEKMTLIQSKLHKAQNTIRQYKKYINISDLDKSNLQYSFLMDDIGKKNCLNSKILQSACQKIFRQQILSRQQKYLDDSYNLKASQILMPEINKNCFKSTVREINRNNSKSKMTSRKSEKQNLNKPKKKNSQSYGITSKIAQIIHELDEKALQRQRKMGKHSWFY